MDLLNNILRVWAMHREFRAVFAELDSYADRELMSDLGLARGDVARVAYEEAERRVGTPILCRALPRAGQVPTLVSAP